MSILSCARSGLILGMVAAPLASCGQQQADPRTLPPLVRTAEAGFAEANDREFTGVVGARVESDLGFRVSGKVVARLVEVGQRVRRGQPLMRIDSSDYALAAQATGAAVEAARARLAQTTADEQRYRNLVSAGAVSAADLDRATAAARAARAELSAAEARTRASRNDVAYTVMVADADGTIVETLAEPGQVVGTGQVVIRLARSGPREAILDLPETVRPVLGTAAQARTYGGLEGAARLRQLSDAADPMTRTFEARFVLAGAPAAAPLGSTVTVSFTMPDEEAAIAVPLGAIHDRGLGPGVWIVSGEEEPKVTWRPVRLASLGEETATIAAGLRRGERFVTLGAHLLRQNQAVRIATGTAR